MIADAPPSFESLQLHMHGAVARLRLNRPQRLNALSPALMGEIIAASRWLAVRDELRVLLLDGAGRAFCAGFDLKVMRESRGRIDGPVDGQTDSNADRESADLGRQMLGAFEAIPAITLAAVRGHCIGGGLLLAAACGLRIVADDARFSIPEMDIGIPLGWGGVPRLVRLLGPTVAMELVLDCRAFDAAQALAWRFVNRVVPAAELDAHSLAWAQRLALHPVQALRATKQRFAEAAEALCSSSGSQADADTLRAAYRDPQTLQAMQRYMQGRQR